MEKSRFLLLAIFLVVGFSSCKKDNWEEASFRCKVNGEEFIATEKFATAKLQTNSGPSYVLDVDGTRLVNFLNKKQMYGEMKLNSLQFDANEIGVEQEGNQFFYFGNNTLDKTIRSQYTVPGTYMIENLDEASKKVSGRFELQAIADDGTTYEITEGYFNLDYKD